jgi:hypothetical protein
MTMSKRNKRTPSTAAARSSRTGAHFEKSIPASKARSPSRHAQFVELLSALIKQNVRMMLFLSGAASIAQPFIPWTNDNSDAMWFIVIGSIALGLAVPPRLWR